MHTLIRVWLAGLLIGFTSTSTQAAFCPFSTFAAMSDTELGTLQVKLTYVGTQSQPLKGIAFTSHENLDGFSMEPFTPYRSNLAGKYLNDDFGWVDILSVSVQELAAFIDSVSVLPGITDGNADPNGTLSFMLVNTTGPSGPCGFEAILDDANSRALFVRMRRCFNVDPATTNFLNHWGCELNVLPLLPAVNVTKSTEVTLSGLRLDHERSAFVADAAVKNLSGALLPGPLSLVPGPLGENDLAVMDGRTCQTSPVGLAYVDVPVGAGLSPGQTVHVLLQFSDPLRKPLKLEPLVYSGPGER